MRTLETIRQYVYKAGVTTLDFLFPETKGVKRRRVLANTDIQSLLKTKLRPAFRDAPEIFPLFSYGDPLVKDIVWELKYRGNPRAVELCANELYTAITEELKRKDPSGSAPPPLLIPIPISRKRLRERGFNQNELLVRYLFLIDKEKIFSRIENVLYKIKDTKNQTGIKDKKERRQNVRGCFAVKDATAVAGRTIFLIDDVVTTGSTISEAKKALLSAGAHKVLAFAIAH